MENPANRSFTKIEILRGSSKLPRVTLLTANRDWQGSSIELFGAAGKMPIPDRWPCWSRHVNSPQQAGSCDQSIRLWLHKKSFESKNASTWNDPLHPKISETPCSEMRSRCIRYPIMTTVKMAVRREFVHMSFHLQNWFSGTINASRDIISLHDWSTGSTASKRGGTDQNFRWDIMFTLWMQKLTRFHWSWVYPVQDPRHSPRFFVKFIDLLLDFLADGAVETNVSGKWVTDTSRISISLSSRSLSCSTSRTSMLTARRRGSSPRINAAAYFYII